MHMADRNIRRWALLGALVSTALLAPACGKTLPKEGTANEGVVNEAQKNETLGTGGSGVQTQQPIGAPGYSSPREDTQISPQPVEPQPQLKESGGNRKADQRLKMNNQNQDATQR
jgi:hypothetical protein